MCLSICSQDIEWKRNYDVLKILSGNEMMNKILTSIKGHNSVTNVRKMMCNNPNLDLVSSNAYTKFGKILSIYSQDIERK